MKHKILLLVLASIVPLSAATNDKILDMIRRIDPYGLNELYIPGFFIKAEEKRRYETAAKEVTDKAYRSLHSVSLFDFVRLIKGSLKGCAGIGAAYATYLYSTGKYDLSLLQPEAQGDQAGLKYYSLSDGKTYWFINRYSVYGVLGSLAAYLLNDARREFSDVLNKKERVLAYHNALAQEAYISRLPVCDVGAGDTILEN
jgi:hypothetical protein